MAKTTEEVEVVFTADTSKYTEETQKAEKSTNSFVATIGSFIQGTILAGASLLKINAVMKLFNIQTLLGIENLALFNITMGSITKAIWAQIPAWIKLRAVIISTGIGALVVAFVSLIAALKNTVVGSDVLTTVWKTMGNVMQGVLDILTGIGKALIGLLTGDWQLATEGLEQAWDGVANGIGRAAVNANILVQAQRELSNLMINFSNQVDILETGIDDIRVAMEAMVEDTAAWNFLNDKLIQQEKELVALKQTELNAQILILEAERLGGVGSQRELDIQKELNDLKIVQRALTRDIRDADAEFLQRQEDRLELLKEDVKEVEKLKELFVVDDFEVDPEEAMDYINFMKEIQEEKVRIWREANEEIAKDTEEILDDSLAAQLEATKRAAAIAQKDADIQVALRKKQAQSFEDFKLNALQQGFALAQNLAGENQELRGAIMVAEAIANTALGISRAPADYGAGAVVAIPLIAALGAAQVATIIAQMGGTANGTVDAAFQEVDRREASTFLREGADFNKQQVVLVTEDLHTVENRVEIADTRAKL